VHIHVYSLQLQVATCIIIFVITSTLMDCSGYVSQAEHEYNFYTYLGRACMTVNIKPTDGVGKESKKGWHGSVWSQRDFTLSNSITRGHAGHVWGERKRVVPVEHITD